MGVFYYVNLPPLLVQGFYDTLRNVYNTHGAPRPLATRRRTPLSV